MNTLSSDPVYSRWTDDDMSGTAGLVRLKKHIRYNTSYTNRNASPMAWLQLRDRMRSIIDRNVVELVAVVYAEGMRANDDGCSDDELDELDEAAQEVCYNIYTQAMQEYIELLYPDPLINGKKRAIVFRTAFNGELFYYSENSRDPDVVAKLFYDKTYANKEGVIVPPPVRPDNDEWKAEWDVASGNAGDRGTPLSVNVQKFTQEMRSMSYDAFVGTTTATIRNGSSCIMSSDRLQSLVQSHWIDLCALKQSKKSKKLVFDVTEGFVTDAYVVVTEASYGEIAERCFGPTQRPYSPLDLDAQRRYNFVNEQWNKYTQLRGKVNVYAGKGASSCARMAAVCASSLSSSSMAVTGVTCTVSIDDGRENYDSALSTHIVGQIAIEKERSRVALAELAAQLKSARGMKRAREE